MSSKNPPGWNEPGMQPIDWAERVEHQKAAAEALLGPAATEHVRDYIKLARQLPTYSEIVEAHYLAAFEAWERQRTKPESRWQFADRMAKLAERALSQ